MAGIENKIIYGQGFKLQPSGADDIARMQNTDTASFVNFDATPEAAVSANIGSLCIDRIAGNLYIKQTGTGNTGWNLLGSGIVTINGDSGTATGTTLTIYASNADLHCGSSVMFENSGTVCTLTVSDANFNTLIGVGCGKSGGTGFNNTGFGRACLSNITSADSNTALGVSALQVCSSGNYNTACGTTALQSLSTGIYNTACGRGALVNITSGSYNTSLGISAGANLTSSDSNCIHIANLGVTGDNNVIRIGTQGTGDYEQNTCFIAGINGSAVTGSAVLCAADGQLGTIVSSARYKENIEDMPEDVSVMNLRPVQFTYKTKNKNEVNNLSYGLIAEEVDKDFPYLCFYKDGEPESVKYHELCIFLLAEIQRLDSRLKKIEYEEKWLK